MNTEIQKNAERVKSMLFEHPLKHMALAAKRLDQDEINALHSIRPSVKIRPAIIARTGSRQEAEAAMMQLNQRSQAPDIVALRERLQSYRIEDVVNTLRSLDKEHIKALNLNINREGCLFTHRLIEEHLTSIHAVSRERHLIEALSLMEVEAFNIYDLLDAHNTNALDNVLNAVLMQQSKSLDFVGSRTLHYVAKNMSNIDCTSPYRRNGKSYATPLHKAAISGSFPASRILIGLGADMEIKMDNGLDFHGYADAKKETDTDFYLAYRAMMLLRQQEDVAVSPCRRMSL